MQIYGIGASSGIAWGRAYWIRSEHPQEDTGQIDPAQAEAESARLDEAVSRSLAALESIREKLAGEGREHEAEIFEAHLMLLEDEELVGAARDKITTEYFSAEAAMASSADEVAAVIASLDDPYLRERAADIYDISRRVIRTLRGETDEGITVGEDGMKRILIAEDLSPSDTAQLDVSVVGGFVTMAGGSTSHSAIIARSVGIPAIVGAGVALTDIEDGQLVAIDGTSGEIIVEPSESVLRDFRGKHEADELRKTEHEAFRFAPSASADGVTVELVANIGSVADAKAAKELGAEGIGLFRTEFLYMGREQLPNEEDQFEAYRAVAEAFGDGAPVVIRTMDIGGDKELASLQLEKEDNPFLGYRAIRICLDRTDLFKTQLRAILRASAYGGGMKIMFPMIATLSEWRQAKALVEESKAELASEGVPFNNQIEVGIMIEIPAAAMMADRFAKEVDFFSIGTNDLVQYTMAADRMNPKLRKLTDPLHPPVLRLIDRVIRAAHAEGKWAGMCGEMAGQPLALPILLGMGLDEFSMSAGSVAQARWLLAKLSKERLALVAEAVLELDDASEVRRYIEANVPEAAGH
ncbi:phosphoenolpyruvate--protein phosphotransferase [Paenibacillus kobensis]|uniref:phosphoenolpyruvate--protein phosphotransferase n=1 Tax=Paenibacillus kobensis TaxID=59841 RepID=UPI000FD86032|nr:phosphoenolpyruvate--protein phosphotransferase [Paenibacillus kobensis]